MSDPKLLELYFFLENDLHFIIFLQIRVCRGSKNNLFITNNINIVRKNDQ